MIATITKHTGSHYLLSALPEWREFPAVLRGAMRKDASKSTNPVAVGDIVEYDLPAEGEPSAENPCVIRRVKPRKNYIIRQSTNLSRKEHVLAANIDRAFIIVTPACPEVKLPLLDRILLTCRVYGIEAVIVLNKVDLCRDIEGLSNVIDDYKRIYCEGAGYEMILTCALDGTGVDTLREMCRDRVCLFSGVSGTGKSSLIKALDASLDPKVGRISYSHLQGRHTTTFYEMYPISSGGFIIDTPGIRGFGLVNLTKEEIGLYFPEFLALAPECRYKPCTHTHEPGCAVKKALEEGRLSPERYSSYLGMLEEDSKYR